MMDIQEQDFPKKPNYKNEIQELKDKVNELIQKFCPPDLKFDIAARRNLAIGIIQKTIIENHLKLMSAKETAKVFYMIADALAISGDDETTINTFVDKLRNRNGKTKKTK